MKAWLITLMLATAAANAIAAESGYTLRDTELRDQPFLDARVKATLPQKTVVEVMSRQGGWMEIRTTDGEQRGWARMLNVRLGDPNRRPASGNILSALGIGNRTRPQTTATVTTGVRGFSEEDLAKAAPNPAEVEKMKGFAASSADASQLAAQANLQARKVGYFDADGKPLEGKK